MAASSDALGQLHQLLAEIMIEELRWYREQNPPIPVPAADKAAVSKFLKDNNITCDPADVKDIERLRDEFQKSRQESRLKAAQALTKEDLESIYH